MAHPLILAAFQILTSISATTLDSTSSDLRLIVGPTLAGRVVPALWGDLGIQLDFNPVLVRYTFGLAVGQIESVHTEMAPGQSRPELDAYHHSFAGGYQLYWRSGWMAAGGGWAWTIADSLRTDDENRKLYMNVDGKTSVVDRSAAWIWKERLRRNGPFGFLELGFGLREIGIGLKLEFGESVALGCNIQYRFL